jgi:HK97 family phage major capsid protein
MKVIEKRALVKWARKDGFKGKTLDELKAHIEDNYGEIRFGGEVVDVEKSWANTKAVEIRTTAGEEINVIEDDISTDEMNEEDIEKMDGEEDDESVAKRAKPRRAKTRAEMDARMAGDRAPKRDGMTAKNWQNIAKRKMYDSAARNGGVYRGEKCHYADADRAEFAAALLRLKFFSNGSHGVSEAYAPQRRLDEDIVQKTGTIQSATSYGNMVIEEYLPELIELFPTYGAARQVATVTPMSRDTLTVHKWGADVSVYDVGETDEITPSDGTSFNVSLVAKKTAALVKNSSEILNDSALDLANILTGSIARAIAKWEDESYFNGAHNRAGLLNGIDSDSTFDATLSTGWGDYTISDLQDWKAKLAGWALEDPDLAIVCNPSFYESVLKVRAYSAGGTPGDAILNGTRVRAWDGVPVVFSHVMPSSYSANQISAYIGSFKRATKFGVVRGSEEMATSDQRYFENDIVAMRYTQRWAINCHEISGTNTGVVALKD